MHFQISRRKTCRLCDATELERVLPLAPTPVSEKYVTKSEIGQAQPTYPLDLYMCRGCGHVQLLDVIDAKFLFDNYTYVSANTAALVQHFGECAERVCRRFHPAPNALVVDIGSNDGSLLRCFQERGMRVLGVDPALEIAEKATQSGIETLPEFLTPDLARRIRKEYGPAAVVTAFNVFAHADDLAGMADSIREMLVPDGVFLFEFSYLLDVVDRMLLGTIFHEHLSYHSIKPMIPFLRRHGMDMIDAERVMIQGGSIVGTAQIAGGPHAASPIVDELLKAEAARDLDRPEALQRFATQLQNLRERLGGMLADFQRQGKSFAGFGAARSGTTLIAQMGLGKLLSFVVDDSPDKQNTYTPGDHIPVLPTSALYEQRPDYVFILAWIHAAKIIENNRRYLDQGGHFILCFPDIQVIGKEGVHDHVLKVEKR